MILTMIRPGLVYPSGKPATRTDYDCDVHFNAVGRLSSRESWEQLKSGVSKALSNFFEKKVKKQFTNTKERVIIYI